VGKTRKAYSIDFEGRYRCGISNLHIAQLLKSFVRIIYSHTHREREGERGKDGLP
jgi:hypothetical protein